MKKIHSNVDTYQPEFPKLSVVNSLAVNGRVFYIAKKFPNGKSSGSIIHVYDYKTKMLVTRTRDNNFIVPFLEKQDFGVFDDS